MQRLFTNEGAKEHRSVGHQTVSSACTTAVYHLKYAVLWDLRFSHKHSWGL